MHVGVCMRIRAESFQEAKNQAQNLLVKYSQEDFEDKVEIAMPLKDYYKMITGVDETDMNTIKLYFQIENNGIIDFLEEKITDRMFYEIDCEDESTKKIIEEFCKIYTEDELDATYIGEVDDEESLYFYINYESEMVQFTLSIYRNEGHWDYDYGTTESFGLADDNVYRIFSGGGRCFKKENKNFLDKLFNGTESEADTCGTVCDYFLNEKESCSCGGDINFLKDMFSDIDENTYFITGSVHI